MTDGDRNSGSIAGRDPSSGRFAKGNGGRPKGTRHRVTKAIEALLDKDATRLTRKAVKMALEGDGTALRLCLDRLLPPKRPGDRPIEIELPAAPAEALAAIIEATGSGALLLSDAEKLAALVKAKADLASLAELEERVARLEGAK